jgi:hypothetical protein
MDPRNEAYNNDAIMPLIQAFQSVEDYQMLGLSRNNFSFTKATGTVFQSLK